MMDLKRINAYMAKVAASEKRCFKPTGKKLKAGLDLGTAYIVIVVLDENDNPVACEKEAAGVLRDGVVVDYQGALAVVPAGTEGSVRTHQYIAEGAGFEVTEILDEPTAANSVYKIDNGVVVDIGGGTTGLAVFKDGVVEKIYDEPTGGTHLSLVLSGNYRIPFEQAEAVKQDYRKHGEIFPIVRPVIEKMATIVARSIDRNETDTIYLCGGTSCLTGIEEVFEKVTGIHTVKPDDPFLVTPAGIAMNCKV